ncbi:MAG: hypothetical protein WBD48_08130, partial [Pseudolabrys sp.]
PIERMSLHADMMTQRGASLKKLADAAKPLSDSLDEAQKHRFTVLAQLEGRRFGHWRPHGGWRHHGSHGQEQGPAQQQ